MHSTQVSSALPFSLRSLSVLVLGLLGPLCGTEALSAQTALEIESGSVRIWKSSTDSERVPMLAGRLPVVAVPAEGGYFIAGEDLRTGDLFFVHRTADQSIEIPVPSSKSGPLRSSPVLLTTGDRLEGTAWLEGSSRQDFTILASTWNGTSWETVETVSIQKTGPQLALSATILDDDSWLVVWAGYDGSDDDIFWSRRVDGTWSEPQRLHTDNQVPDILPTVTTIGDSAAAAWNFFDGNDYRIRTATWTGTGWALGQTLAGRGPGQPAFESVDGRSFLTYRTVAPEVWNLIEFERDGSKRQSAITVPFAERPLVVFDAGSPASLSWPWRREARRP
jgi:hypothetical protein